MNRIATFAAGIVLLATGIQAHATDACTGFKWNVAHEVELFRHAPVTLAAGGAVATAPAIQIDQLYALDLQPQEAVTFKASTSKKMLSDGAYAGVLRLRVDQAGAYRVAIDSGFWLDVVHDGKPLSSIDFNGSQDCAGPRKIVVYELPAGADLFVQLSAVNGPHARLSITRVPASP